MPFTKTGPDEYTSPSGRKFTGKQVRLYYANGESFPGEDKPKVGKLKPARSPRRR